MASATFADSDATRAAPTVSVSPTEISPQAVGDWSSPFASLPAAPAAGRATVTGRLRTGTLGVLSQCKSADGRPCGLQGTRRCHHCHHRACSLVGLGARDNFTAPKSATLVAPVSVHKLMAAPAVFKLRTNCTLVHTTTVAAPSRYAVTSTGCAAARASSVAANIPTWLPIRITVCVSATGLQAAVGLATAV